MGSILRSQESREWPLTWKVAFRFFFIYFILYTFPFPVSPFDLSESLAQSVKDLWNILAQDIAPWLGVEGPVDSSITGSGDRISDYLILLVQSSFAAFLTIIWSFADRKRPSYTTLLTILFIVLRYYLAWNMFIYGYYKVFKLQFPFPSLYRLVQPYGDSSPMGLAWTYMGYSDTYSWFAGALEIIGGSLLLFRRTATLGALASFGVMLNVFMMNMSFDIPVKLFSLHLLVMALFITLPDVQRLLNVLLFNRATEPRLLDLDLGPLWARISRWVAKLAFIGFAIVYGGINVAGMMEQYGESAPKPPHYGIYDVEEFVLNSDTIPPLTTDPDRWSRIIVNYPGTIRLYYMENGRMDYQFAVDSLGQSVSLTQYADSVEYFSGNIVPLDSARSRWSGIMMGDTLDVTVKRYDEQNFTLVNRGFHWVNEYPYNR